MKLNKYFLILIILITLKVNAQDYSSDVFSGTLISTKTRRALPGANIINLNSLKGVSSSDTGLFGIQAKINDTILISFLGYKTINIKVTKENINRHQTIYLSENPMVLDEVILSSKQLTGIINRDVEIIPIHQPINIQPKINAMFGDPKPNVISNFNDALKQIMDPVDLIYNIFSRQAKDLRRLKKIQNEDKVRKMLSERYDRELLSRLLNVDKKDVYLVLESCDYSDNFIKQANDLQILEALLHCYNKYKMYMKPEKKD